ncbi:MAG: hypothetical protein LBQ58_05860 [Synergistaceae bacterium]|jgi:hypothetical protein|nr:hypothetical protein [Synergistaceae bacterium]
MKLRKNLSIFVFAFFVYVLLGSSLASAADKYAYDLKKPETVIRVFALACINENVKVLNDMYPPDAQQNADKFSRMLYGKSLQELLFDALYGVKESDIWITLTDHGFGDERWELCSTCTARNKESLGKGGSSFTINFNRHGKISEVVLWTGSDSPSGGKVKWSNKP